MNNSIVISIVFFFLYIGANAQSKKQISQLEDLCKAWGNLKYFHPEIATGKYNWDSILIMSINQVLNSNTNSDFQKIIDEILQIAGPNDAVEFEINKSGHPYNYRNINHTWVNKSKNLSVVQKKRFNHNYSHPFQGVNYYAQPNKDNEGTVVTAAENPYKEMIFPDIKYRLLGLFRYWNVINYFYPYKYAIGKSWDGVLSECIPKFINAIDIGSYQYALAELAASINDSHGILQPYPSATIAGKYRPPFIYRIIEDKAMVTKVDLSLLNNADIQAGYVIESINNVPVTQKIKEYWGYVSASNPGGKILAMQTILLRSNDTVVSLKGYRVDGTQFSTKIRMTDKGYSKEDYVDINGTSSSITSKLISNEIGYIFASNINDKNLDSIINPLLKTKAIIIDLRNYPPTGTVAFKLPNYLLTTPMTYARLTRPDFRMPGLLVYENANKGKSVERVGQNNTSSYKGKLILLVDSRTMSGAEFTCMALQTYKNVMVIGNQTSGADGNVTGVSLPGGFTLYFSGFGIYYPDDRETQRVGIPIDIYVNYSLRDFIKKKDAVLEKAIEYIKSEK